MKQKSVLQLLATSAAIASMLLGVLQSCKTPNSSGLKEGSDFDIEKSWAQTLSQEITTAKQQAEDLKDTRAAIGESESMDEALEAIRSHHQKIVDVAASLEIALNRMKQKMVIPQVSADVKDVARVSNQEYTEQLSTVEELTKANGLLDGLSIASSKFYAASAASLAALSVPVNPTSPVGPITPIPADGQPGIIVPKQSVKAIYRKAVIDRINEVNAKLQTVITAVNGWVAAANKRGSIGGNPNPNPTPVPATTLQTRVLSGIFIERSGYNFYQEASYNGAVTAAKQKCEAWINGLVLPPNSKVRIKSCSTPTQVVAKENGFIAAQIDATLKFEFSVPSNLKLATITESFPTRSSYDFFLEAEQTRVTGISVKKCNDRIALIKSLSRVTPIFTYCEPPVNLKEFSISGYKDSNQAASSTMQFEYGGDFPEKDMFQINERVSVNTAYNFFNPGPFEQAEPSAIEACKKRAGEVLASRPGSYAIVLQCVGPIKTLSPTGNFAVSYDLKGQAIQPD